VLELDVDAGRVTAEGGVSLDTLMRELVPRGWFVPVTPGTRHVTVGGAIAADIHGKNHHHDGSFMTWVERLRLATPVGTFDVTPGGDHDLFWATAGGLGLTGVVLDATFRLVACETAFMAVDTDRLADLDAVMDAMVTGDDQYRYSVAWIDLMARGAALGRSVLTRARHAALADLPPKQRSSARAFAPGTVARAPGWVMPGLLNRASIRAFNEFWFRKAPRRRRDEVQPLASYFHILDAVDGWNRLYGRRGFLQYQFVVPDGAEATLRRAVERFSTGQVPSFLAVLKRFGPGNDGPLSFPLAGWTLALDVPTGISGLAPMLDAIDDDIAAAGGRVYLAKDSRLRPALLGAMYPRLDEWRRSRAKVDPDHVLRSDLDRRLGLVAGDGTS